MPDELTIELWRARIADAIAQGIFNPATDYLVLDGIPRNIHQAKMLDQYIEVVKLICLRAVHNRDEMIRRLKSRALKENRLDDANDQTIRHRLDIYDKESRPVLAHYPKEISVDVNALQTPIEVAHDILSAILGRLQEMREVPPPPSTVAARN